MRSHEVARFIYSKNIQERVTDLFDENHFKLSCDTLRVISFPESLNAQSGLICSYLGKPKDFFRLSVWKIIKKARSRKDTTEGLNWTASAVLLNKNRNVRALALFKNGLIVGLVGSLTGRQRDQHCEQQHPAWSYEI